MSKIIIATSVDKGYYENRSNSFLKSIEKNSNIDKNIVFTIDFELEDKSYTNIESVKIDSKNLKSSVREDVTNRKFYVCLENGEFINFYKSFNDEDILILSDYDVVLQRPFSSDEIELIRSIKGVGLTPNCFDNDCSLLREKKNLKAEESLFLDIDPNWKIYNAGIQIAKISTWKFILDEWNKLYEEVYNKVKHHATGQLLFNYICHKNNLIQELDPLIHTAHWFYRTPAKIENNKLKIQEKEVLFNHHKFQYKPLF